MSNGHGRYGNDPFADDDQVPDDPFAADYPAPEDPFAHPTDDVPVDPATGEVDGESPSLEGRVKGLEEAVAEISELLALAPGGPWVWLLLEPEARRQLATDLVEWVRWFSDRYLAHLSEETVLKLPPRWFTHPVVVELLTALYVAYISVYSNRPRTPTFGLVEWHERCLWPTIERLKALKLVDRNGRLSDHTHVVTTDADAVDHLVADLLENDVPAL